MPKISVIIPVYNAEKYLNKTLESILKQSLKDIEVICVDDGSTDGSVEIVNKAIKSVAKDFTRKVKVVAEDVKDIAQERAQDIKDVVSEKKNHISMDKQNTDYKMDNESNYTYTVRFDDNDNE